MAEAEKKMVVVIDEIVERLEDSTSGWGKYKIKVEGYEGVYRVDVPSFRNREVDLEEGFIVTLVEGASKYEPDTWRVHGNSECFTGQPFNIVDEGDAPATTTASATKKVTKRETYTKKESANGTQTTPKVEAASTPTPAPKVTKTKAQGFNEYQINVRDPQMRMQTLTEISFSVHKLCVENDLDPEGVFKQVIEDAIMLDEAVMKHLGL